MDVYIRLVPRTRSVPRRRDFFGEISSGSIGEMRPDPRRMRSAMQKLSERGVAATPTRTDRIEAIIPAERMLEEFGTAVYEKKIELSERAITMSDTYLAPEREIQVPEELQDVIDFAYVPRPVEFFASSYISPVENVYHLALHEVQLALQAGRCHRRGWTGRGVKVAMADSGFLVHPFFSRNGFTLVPTQSPGSGDPTIDTSGHGTGEAANIFAMAPDCTVFGVKHGFSAASTLEACVDLNPHIMTNSWGWDVDHVSKSQLEQTDPNFFNELVDIETVILQAVTSGITVFFSAGNGHRAFPASIPEVLAIGGVTVQSDGDLEASSYASSFRSKLYPGRRVPNFCGVVGESASAPQPGHIMLPVPANSDLDGENFPSGAQGTGWGIFSGTSAASPQAAGIAALLKGISKNLSPASIQSILSQTATDVVKGKTAHEIEAVSGPDDATGAGFMNAFSACEIAGSIS